MPNRPDRSSGSDRLTAADSDEADLHERRHAIVHRCLQSLMAENPQFYYQPTSTIARAIHGAIRQPESLTDEERDAVRPLDVRDIEMLLAFR